MFLLYMVLVFSYLLYFPFSYKAILFSKIGNSKLLKSKGNYMILYLHTPEICNLRSI